MRTNTGTEARVEDMSDGKDNLESHAHTKWNTILRSGAGWRKVGNILEPMQKKNCGGGGT